MGPRLNPDGAKIRALRIQRGWTQEQLAEIAGVSSRTIQRAETAGCAGFETLRALAGAFEADFTQLLMSEARAVREPQSAPLPLLAAAPRPQPSETLWFSRPAPSGWSALMTLKVVAVALVAGLLTGGILVHRFHTPVGLQFSTPRQSQIAAVPVGVSIKSGHRDTAPVQAPKVVLAQASTVTEAAFPDRKSEPATGEPKHQNSAVQEAEILQLASVASQTAFVSSPQIDFLDLPEKPRELPKIPAISELPGWNPYFIPPGDLTQNEEGTGAVRQAVGQAAKKTGEAFAKVSASMRRAF